MFISQNYVSIWRNILLNQALIHTKYFKISLYSSCLVHDLELHLYVLSSSSEMLQVTFSLTLSLRQCEYVNM